MTNENIYYINVKPYIHDLEFSEMINRFWNSILREKIFFFNKKMENKEHFELNMTKTFQSFDYLIFPKTEEEKNIDKIVSKQILIHLQEFFDEKSNKNYNKKTITKSNKIKKNKTKKRR